jgi:hypothetical protein
MSYTPQDQDEVLTGNSLPIESEPPLVGGPEYRFPVFRRSPIVYASHSLGLEKHTHSK